MVMEFATDPDNDDTIKKSWSRQLLLGDNKFDCDCDASWALGINSQKKLPTSKINIDELSYMGGKLDMPMKCSRNDKGAKYSIGDFIKKSKRQETKKFMKTICDS